MTQSKVLEKVSGRKEVIPTLLNYERVEKCCLVCDQGNSIPRCESCKKYGQRNRYAGLTCSKGGNCHVLGETSMCGSCRIDRFDGKKKRPDEKYETPEVPEKK